ncbi:helicase, partial [Acinetobacter baumannii]
LNDFDDEDLELFAKQLTEKENRKISKDYVDPVLLEKRPAQAREQLRKLIVKKVEDEISSLLVDLGYNPKGTELWQSFTRHLPYLKPNTANDGTLVNYVNLKLSNKFGRVISRDNPTLVKSLDHIPSLIEEVRKML